MFNNPYKFNIKFGNIGAGKTAVENKLIKNGTISSPTLLDIQEYKTMKNIRSIKLADKGVKINYWNCSTKYFSYLDFINEVNDRKL